MGAEAKNFEAIVKGKEQHNKNCPFPPHTVRMHPIEIERMQWDEGDTIAGLVLEADPKIGTGTFRLICDGMEPPELDVEETEVIEAPSEPIEVPVGPERVGTPVAGAFGGGSGAAGRVRWHPSSLAAECCGIAGVQGFATKPFGGVPATRPARRLLLSPCA